MKYQSPQIETESDFIRFVGKVFIMLYLFAVCGLVVTWQIEGGSLWPTVITAIIAAPLMLVTLLIAKPSGLRTFRRYREAAERILKTEEIEHIGAP
jgi:hypothetical protein